MTTKKKPSFTKIIIDNENGLNDLSDFTSNKNEAVKITRLLFDVIHAAIEWSPLDFSDCILIDGLSVSNFMTLERPSNVDEIIKQIKIDAIQTALDSGDERQIENLYLATTGNYKLTPIAKDTLKPRKTTASSDTTPQQRAEEKLTDTDRATILKNIAEAHGKNLIPVAKLPGVKADEGCMNITIKIKGLTVPNDSKVAAEVVYSTLECGKILNNANTRKVLMKDAGRLSKYFAELGEALTAKG